VGGGVTTDTYSATYDSDDTGSFSSSRSYAASYSALVIQSIKATLVAGYIAARQCTERVSLTLFADVQPILTDPEDGEAMRFDDFRSVNLSEVIDGTPPIIDDPRRRSYIATARGNQSIEHLIAFARAQLMKRARVVEITFAPKLSRMPEITLRKNAFLAEPRVGEAVGKIIGYSLALDGNDGRINCQVRIGCTIGRGGVAVATEGMPTYASTDYVGFDYQQFVERTVLVDAFEDSSVGYQPPDANPNDDGIDFLSGPRVEDVVEVGLVVEHGAEPDADLPEFITESGDLAEIVKARFETRAKFKLKSMTREFTSDYEIAVTDLQVPTGYDLEAV
jgi:hypothetical protein